MRTLYRPDPVTEQARADAHAARLPSAPAPARLWYLTGQLREANGLLHAAADAYAQAARVLRATPHH